MKRIKQSVVVFAIVLTAGFVTSAVAEIVSGTNTVLDSAITNNKPIDSSELMRQARDAMLQNDNRRALMFLDQVLRLPPNTESQQAQELAGVVRERLQEIDKAKQEYELYLRLYPEGDDAERVRQRLASIINTPQESIVSRRTSERITQSQLNGSLVQYYYHGNSKIELTPLNFQTNPIDVVTLTKNDQSALVSNIALNGRYRDGASEHRFVFRDAFTNDFRTDASTPNKQRLTNAYYDYRNRNSSTTLRLGRQPANNTGVYGRFDGASAAAAVMSQWRIGGVAGVVSDYMLDVSPRFYGVNSEVTWGNRAWTVNSYVIDQTVGKVTDRRALGLELRYFETARSFLTTLDYDMLFERINSIVANGNILLDDAWQLNYSVDYRRLPFLQVSNVMLTEPGTTIDVLFSRYDVDALRKRALAATAESFDYLVGTSYKWDSHWQMNVDGRVTQISSLSGAGQLPYTPGTGNIYSSTFQVVGNAVLGLQDMSVVSASVFYNKDYTGWSTALTERVRLFNRWTNELILRFYKQANDNGTKMERLSPSLRVSYRWHDNAELELEVGVEKSRNKGLVEADNVERVYGSAGYQWFF